MSQPRRSTRRCVGLSQCEGATFYMFIHATLSPQEVWFLPIVRVALPVPILDSLTDDAFTLAREDWLNEKFQVLDPDYLRHDKLPAFEVGDACVLEHLVFHGDGVVATGCFATPLEYWM